MSPESPRPAGWYDDEANASRLRYWDGNAWSPHTTPRPSDAPASPVPPVVAPATSASPPAPAAPASAAAAPTASPAGPAAPPAFPGAPAFDDGIDEATTARPLRAAAAAEPQTATLPAPPERGIDEHTTAPIPPHDGGAPAPVPPHGGLGGFGVPVPPPPPYGDGAASAASAPGFSYAPYQTTGRTFLATWLFALLLGFWGADRFYLGKIGTAIAKLLTLGGLGVWVLVDLLLVLTGTQRDRDGRALEGYEEHHKVAWIVSGALVAFGLLSSVLSNVITFSMR